MVRNRQSGLDELLLRRSSSRYQRLGYSIKTTREDQRGVTCCLLLTWEGSFSSSPWSCKKRHTAKGPKGRQSFMHTSRWRGSHCGGRRSAFSGRWKQARCAAWLREQITSLGASTAECSLRTAFLHCWPRSQQCSEYVEELCSE